MQCHFMLNFPLVSPWCFPLAFGHRWSSFVGNNSVSWIWAMHDGHCRLEICGDSKVVINWVNAEWPSKFLPYSKAVGRMQQTLHTLVADFAVRPRLDSCDFCRHIFRELNRDADALATKHCNSWSLEVYATPSSRLRGLVDGSVQGHKAACGWVVLALRPGG